MLPPGTKLMSADDHMIEPPDLWVDRVPTAYRDPLPSHRRGRRSSGVAVRGRADLHPHGLVPAVAGIRRGRLPAGSGDSPLR